MKKIEAGIEAVWVIAINDSEIGDRTILLSSQDRNLKA